MGFDIECIVNIQSLAGEYFCPVCGTLVYPKESLESRCSHLYCKPCLTYVAGTTKACPYDGCLVTEAGSKPLVESNKALAEVIDRITVHCLFHKSGCSWQGPLSECTSHCAGCVFGSYPVLCNRCGIQIVHRQVQEHAQNCPGTYPQALQNVESVKDVALTTNSSQTISQPVAQMSQATNAPPPAPDSNQANTNAQVQGVTSAVGTIAGQWYPQQFQHYYQQYPGYDPYQQYYPHQQATTQLQVQVQPQSHPQPQMLLPWQQNLEAPLYQQTQSQGHQGQPQMQPQPQSHMQPLLPSQAQTENHPHTLQLNNPQPGHGFQGPVVQPMQQPIQQYVQHPYPLQTSGLVQGPTHQQLSFAQLPMHTHSRPQVPTQSLQHSDVAVLPPPPPPHSGVQAPGVPPYQPQTYPGRPTAPNNSMPPQQFQQFGGAFGFATQARSIQQGLVQTSGNKNFEGGVSNQQQVPHGPQLYQSGQAVKHTLCEGNVAGQEAGSASKRSAGKDVSSGADGEFVVVKPLGSQTGEKSGDEKRRATNEPENNVASRILDNDADGEVNAVKPGSELSTTNFVKVEDAYGNKGGGNEGKTAILDERDSGVVALKQVEYSSAKDSNLRTHDNISSQEQVAPRRLAVDEFGAFQDKGVINSSNPGALTEQGKYHLPSGTSDSSRHQQRLAMPSNLQSGPSLRTPHNALLLVQGPTQIRPSGSGILAPPYQSVYPSEHFQQFSYSNVNTFGGPAAPSLTASFSQGTSQPCHQHESFELSGAKRGQQYQNNPPPSQPVFSKTSNGETVRGPVHGPDGAAMLQNHRPNPYEGRYSDHSVSGSFVRSQYGQPPVDEKCAPKFGTAPGSQDENVNDDHKNPFLVGPAGCLDRGEYPEAPKQFPELSFTGVESSLTFRNDFSSAVGDYRSHEFNYVTSSRFLPPYHQSGGFHPNNIGERSSGFHEDHRARGDSGIDDIHGRDTRTVNEGSRSFYISSDSVGEPFRGKIAGQDFISNQLRKGEPFGPRNVLSHIPRGYGSGTFLDPQMGELTGPGGLPRYNSFAGNKSNRPRLGEPGFRSSYSLHGFPSDGVFHAGKFDSFDRFRTSMGWCRICKVDCDTAEGLDLHSQTTEHQQRSMDIVISIKQQNAKRQKTSRNHSSIEEGTRSRNASNRGWGKKA